MNKLDFLKIAKSFYGCDGGDLGNAIKPSVWFCGIEFGDPSKKSDNLHNINLLPIVDPLSVYKNDEFDKYLTRSPLNQQIARLAVWIAFGKAGTDYKQLIKRTNFLKMNSGFAKLNLYPMAFNNVSNDLWSEANYQATGFFTKEEYRAFCQEHRFKFFSELVLKHSPSTVICFGINESDSFLLAFGGREHFFENKKRILVKGNIKVCTINEGKTKLIISKFPRNNNQYFEEVKNELKFHVYNNNEAS